MTHRKFSIQSATMSLRGIFDQSAIMSPGGATMSPHEYINEPSSIILASKVSGESDLRVCARTHARASA